MIPSERLLPMSGLEVKVGLKRSKIDALIRDSDLPPGKIIHGTRLWRESDIDAWIERTWTSADLCQGGNEKTPTTDANPKAKPPPDAAVFEPTTPVSVYWSSSYLRERYGVSRTTLHRWINTKGFPTPSLPGGHGSQSRWHADDVLTWEAKIRKGKAFRGSRE